MFFHIRCDFIKRTFSRPGGGFGGGGGGMGGASVHARLGPPTNSGNNFGGSGGGGGSFRGGPVSPWESGMGPMGAGPGGNGLLPTPGNMGGQGNQLVDQLSRIGGDTKLAMDIYQVVQNAMNTVSSLVYNLLGEYQLPY